MDRQALHAEEHLAPLLHVDVDTGARDLGGNPDGDLRRQLNEYRCYPLLSRNAIEPTG